MGKLTDRKYEDLLNTTRQEWLEADIIEHSLFHMSLFKYCTRNHINFKRQCEKLKIRLLEPDNEQEKQEKEQGA